MSEVGEIDSYFELAVAYIVKALVRLCDVEKQLIQLGKFDLAHKIENMKLQLITICQALEFQRVRVQMDRQDEKDEEGRVQGRG